MKNLGLFVLFVSSLLLFSCKSSKKAAEQELALEQERLEARKNHKGERAPRGDADKETSKVDRAAKKKAHMNKMMDELGLTRDQMSSFGAINGKYDEKIQQARRTGDRGALGDLVQQRNAEMEKILNVEQYATYVRMMNRRGPKGGGGK